MKTAIDMIVDERKRQIKEEKFTAKYDDVINNKDELAYAAACYAIPSSDRNIYAGQGGISNIIRALWPWEKEWFKLTPENRIRELVKAGALIVAEIERLDRLSTK